MCISELLSGSYSRKVFNNTFLNATNMLTNRVNCTGTTFILVFIRPSKDVLWNGPVRPFTIACERDILKTACQIDFTF